MWGSSESKQMLFWINIWKEKLWTLYSFTLGFPLKRESERRLFRLFRQDRVEQKLHLLLAPRLSSCRWLRGASVKVLNEVEKRSSRRSCSYSSRLNFQNFLHILVELLDVFWRCVKLTPTDLSLILDPRNAFAELSSDPSNQSFQPKSRVTSISPVPYT